MMFDRKDPSVCLLLDSGDRRLKKLSGIFLCVADLSRGILGQITAIAGGSKEGALVHFTLRCSAFAKQMQILGHYQQTLWL
jgi:hypothetical protein